MSMEKLIDMRLCSDCKHDVDIEVPNECEFGKHKWHDPEGDSWDMCCDCGKDVDYLLK
jgi:uncharacterized protein YlaI